jgi:hypothetical protein
MSNAIPLTIAAAIAAAWLGIATALNEARIDAYVNQFAPQETVE